MSRSRMAWGVVLYSMWARSSWPQRSQRQRSGRGQRTSKPWPSWWRSYPVISTPEGKSISIVTLATVYHLVGAAGPSSMPSSRTPWGSETGMITPESASDQVPRKSSVSHLKTEEPTSFVGHTRLRQVPRVGQRPEGPPLHGQSRAEAPPPADLGAVRRHGAVEGTEFPGAALDPEEPRLRGRVHLRPSDHRPGAAGPRPARDGEGPPAARPLDGLGQGRVPGVHYLGGTRVGPGHDRGEPAEDGRTPHTEASDPPWRGPADGPGAVRALRPRHVRRLQGK